jgi:hypothetical protein
MLGYSSTQSSYDIYKHGKELDEHVPSKYKDEVNCIYDWVKTREFCSAMDTNTVESWLWLKKSMVSPPLRIIDKYSSEASKRVEIVSSKKEIRRMESPTCRICDKKLADNIIQKIKFSIIICKCDTIWCHTKCADAHCLQFPSCNMCKQYFILSPCCSSIQSKFVDLMTNH